MLNLHQKGEHVLFQLHPKQTEQITRLPGKTQLFFFFKNHYSDFCFLTGRPPSENWQPEAGWSTRPSDPLTFPALRFVVLRGRQRGQMNIYAAASWETPPGSRRGWQLMTNTWTDCMHCHAASTSTSWCVYIFKALLIHWRLMCPG